MTDRDADDDDGGDIIDASSQTDLVSGGINVRVKSWELWVICLTMEHTSPAMDVLRQVLLANCCIALFLCVDEQYQLHVTMAITVAVLTYMKREHTEP